MQGIESSPYSLNKPFEVKNEKTGLRYFNFSYLIKFKKKYWLQGIPGKSKIKNQKRNSVNQMHKYINYLLWNIYEIHIVLRL